MGNSNVIVQSNLIISTFNSITNTMISSWTIQMRTRCSAFQFKWVVGFKLILFITIQDLTLKLVRMYYLDFNMLDMLDLQPPLQIVGHLWVFHIFNSILLIRSIGFCGSHSSNAQLDIPLQEQIIMIDGMHRHMMYSVQDIISP